MILFRGKGVNLAYNKFDEVKIVFARVIASWAVVIGWISWGDEGVAEACNRSHTAKQNLYGCS